MTIFYSPSSKGFYDSEISYASLPDDIIEITSQQHADLIQHQNTSGHDIVVIDGIVSTVPRVNVPTWKAIRLIRRGYLNKSDYTQMPDYPGDQSAWATYRQALRDIPQNFTNPEDVIWPTPPGV